MAQPRAWGPPTPGKPKTTGPPKPKKPKIPGTPAVRVKPIDPAAQAQQNAMSAFRTALAQLNASTPPVDANAIRAPYQAASVATGQLGTGLQQAVLNSGQAAQQQYGTALNTAQQSAAQFGISAGAGANPTALQNTGAAPLSQQTNAYAAAAPMAATAWQQALERSAGAKIADATLARDQGLTNARQSLATSLPGAIQNERQLGFQQDVQKQNMGLAYSQLSVKDRQYAQQYGLDALKTRLSAGASAAKTAATSASSAASLAERQRHDRATEAAAAKKLAQGDQALAIKRRASTATAKGLKGVAAAVKALSGSSSTGTKPVTGYKVTYVADGNGVNAGGPPVTLFVKDPQNAKPPAGYLPNKTGQPVYGQAGKTSQGLTAKQWDVLMRGMIADNGKGRIGEIKAFLGPRPKK